MGTVGISISIQLISDSLTSSLISIIAALLDVALLNQYSPSRAARLAV